MWWNWEKVYLKIEKGYFKENRTWFFVTFILFYMIIATYCLKGHLHQQYQFYLFSAGMQTLFLGSRSLNPGHQTLVFQPLSGYQDFSTHSRSWLQSCRAQQGMVSSQYRVRMLYFKPSSWYEWIEIYSS